MSSTLPDMMPATTHYYLCIRCEKILRDPQQLSCGHRICGKHIENYNDSVQTLVCGGCLREGVLTPLKKDKIFRDRGSERDMLKYNVPCHNDACPWKGPYTMYDKKHADECPYEEMVCDGPKCKMKIFRKNREHHLMNDCISKDSTDEWIQHLIKESFNGMLVWKIADFKNQRQDSISGKHLWIHSHCFYSGSHGYKMCARMYLNGDGIGKDNYVSLFLVIMKGPSDDVLSWPFRQNITFMWVDQNNTKHLIDNFRPDPKSDLSKRPSQDMNIVSGCPVFMSLSQLSDSRYAYVKNDVAYILVKVDTNDTI
ncbi:TNF receptor-associated factor 3-like [Glandiceps talaboti]